MSSQNALRRAPQIGALLLISVSTHLLDFIMHDEEHAEASRRLLTGLIYDGRVVVGAQVLSCSQVQQRVVSGSSETVGVIPPTAHVDMLISAGNAQAHLRMPARNLQLEAF